MHDDEAPQIALLREHFGGLAEGLTDVQIRDAWLVFSDSLDASWMDANASSIGHFAAWMLSRCPDVSRGGVIVYLVTAVIEHRHRALAAFSTRERADDYVAERQRANVFLEWDEAGQIESFTLDTERGSDFPTFLP